MKICEFVVSCLIVAILGSTVAQDQSGTKNALHSIVASRRFNGRNGGPTAYEESNFENSTRIFRSCVQTLVNLTQFETEMADARPDNKQETVIAKYCLRVPAFEQCIENITESIAPCLEQRERESVDILFGTTKSLLKFACNDGKQVIEDFVAANGSRCVAAKYPAVQACSDGSFPPIKFDAILIPGLGLLPDLSLNVSGCNDIEEYRRCSVNVLAECDNSVVARVVDGLFEFIKGETSCKGLLDVIPGGETESNDLEVASLEEDADNSPEMINYRQ